MAGRTVTLTNRFPEIIGTMPRRISRELKEGAENIASTARNNVNIGPVPRHIADNIEVWGGAGEFSVGVQYGDLYYARFVEFGRANAPPYPFLVPAAAEEAPYIIASIGAVLRSL